jgi:hypothetical protein
VTVSRPPSIRARILDVLTEEPMSALQLAERAGVIARRQGEVVKMACDVLEDEGLIERVGGRRHPKWRRPARLTAEVRMSSTSMALGLDGRLARELVQGLVRSAIARRSDPVARLQEFRTLQQAVIALSRDPAVAETSERLVRAIDLALRDLAAVKS